MISSGADGSQRRSAGDQHSLSTDSFSRLTFGVSQTLCLESAVTSTNAFGVEFKPIPGWNLPTNQAVTVLPGVLITNVAFYTVTNPVDNHTQTVVVASSGRVTVQ